MKVKALIAHDNATFGYDYHKKVGAVYEIDDASAQNLIDQGFVAKVSEKHGSEKPASK